MNTHTIISATPSTNAAVRRAHRRIRRATGAILLEQIPALREIAAMAGEESAERQGTRGHERRAGTHKKMSVPKTDHPLHCFLISACTSQGCYLHSYLVCRGSKDKSRSRAASYIMTKVEELNAHALPVVLETPLEDGDKAIVEEILRRRLPAATVSKLDRTKAKTRDGRFFAMWAMGDDADNRALMALH